MFVTNEPTILLLEEAIFSPPEQDFFFHETKSVYIFMKKLYFFSLKYRDMTLEIKILDRNNHTNVVGLNRIMGSQPSPRDNGNTYIDNS
jgi:hypothetical protein